MDKYEHAKFIIERFDHYYDSVNNKGAFYIALNTFIFGGVCVGYLSLYEKLHADYLVIAASICLLLANITSIFWTVLAITPFLKGRNDKSEVPSMVYFGGISCHTTAHFKQKFIALRDEELLDDLLQQTHLLATGLQKKYNRLKYASYCIIVQFAIMIPLLFLIVKNLQHDIQ